MSTRAEPGPPRRRLWAWSLAYTPAAALVVLLPKCPLCIAAQLALLGVAIPLPSSARMLAVLASVVLGTAIILARCANAPRQTTGPRRPGAGRWPGAASSCDGSCGSAGEVKPGR